MLTNEERRRILDGDHTALRRPERPEWSEGDHQVIRWSRQQTVVTDRATGATAHYPRQPTVTVHFQEPRRHKDGSWRIPIRLEDQRTPTRFLGPQAPPPLGIELTDETARGYRTTAAGGPDELEAVDDDELRKQKVRSTERRAEFMEEMAAEEQTRRQLRAVREQLNELVRGLPLDQAQSLLASLEREMKNWTDT